MHILRDFHSIPNSVKGAAVALGNFDGVHLGHQAILRHCVGTAKADGVPAAVMTFEPHPREFFTKDDKKLRLYSFRDKVTLLEAAGIETLFVMRFNQKLASLSAEAFVKDLLHKTLAVRHVVTGYNFAFGKGRQGNTEFLDHTAAALGMGYTACQPVYDAQGQPISSSAIRAALAAGDAAKAAALLGRPYAVSGHVQRGEGRGRTLGFPTANLSLASLFKPRFGVYAARIAIDAPSLTLPPNGGGDYIYDGVASIGVKPTFGAFEPLLEAHLFDRNEELYGKRLSVRLLEFIRDEERFDTAEALTRRMAEDSTLARKILHAHRQ